MVRPRLSVDFSVVLRLRDGHNLGWSRIAEAYRELTGEYVSRDTMKRRYFEARQRTKDSQEDAPIVHNPLSISASIRTLPIGNSLLPTIA